MRLLTHYHTLSHCPKCNSKWNGEDIHQFFLRKREEGDSFYKDKTDEEILKVANNYGWTEDDPKCFVRLIGIEIRGKYDGIDHWKCPDCDARFPRFKEDEEKIS